MRKLMNRAKRAEGAEGHFPQVFTGQNMNRRPSDERLAEPTHIGVANGPADIPGQTVKLEELAISAPRFTVKSVNWKGHLKRLRLEPDARRLDVPLSACVSVGDRVYVAGGDAWVACRNGMCQFLQPYGAADSLTLGGTDLEIMVKEITEPEEYQAYRALADLHYRGHDIHGRTAKLIIRTFHPTYPKVLGYVELATPFFMNKARANILNAPFHYGETSWDSWNINTLRQHIHLMVRIARTVVSPEFRGFGLGRILVEHAARFARQRWQVAGYMPYFLEISADMLKYVSFVEGAGMHYIGDTEGNLKRVAKDMKYLLGRFGDSAEGKVEFEQISGILDQQVARMDRLLTLLGASKLTLPDFTRRVQRLPGKPVLKDIDLFHGIVSLPKPTYMMGLNDAAQEFLERRVAEVAPQNGHRPPVIHVDRLAGPIRVDSLTVTYVSKVRRTRTTHAVHQAFDISPANIRTTVVRDLNLEIQAGDIVLIVGPSGSGKTTILEALSEIRNAPNAEVEGSIARPPNFKSATFSLIRSDKPLIELFGKTDVREGLFLLGVAGLSEAFLYLKRFQELSRGQQYRAMLARLLASQSNTWIVDEFCSNLDPVTANLVAHNTQRIARQFGATVIAAAAHCEQFVSALKPDKVVVLTSTWEHEVLQGPAYVRRIFSAQRQNGGPPQIGLLHQFFQMVKEGTKRSTIRKGRKRYLPGLLVLCGDNNRLLVRVTDVKWKSFGRLTDDDAKSEGVGSLTALKNVLRAIYPDLRDRSILTIVQFEPLCGEPTRNDG